jgi:hypothetical protein
MFVHRNILIGIVPECHCNLLNFSQVHRSSLGGADDNNVPVVVACRHEHSSSTNIDLSSAEVYVFAADCASRVSTPDHAVGVRRGTVEAADLVAVVVLLEEEAHAAVRTAALFLAISNGKVVVVATATSLGVNWVACAIAGTAPVRQRYLGVGRSIVLPVDGFVTIEVGSPANCTSLVSMRDGNGVCEAKAKVEESADFMPIVVLLVEEALAVQVVTLGLAESDGFCVVIG